jgi:anti-anti-sigma factor
VRAHGLLSGSADARLVDHACWVYDDDNAIAAAAREFVVDGLAGGDRLLCVGDDRALGQLRRATGTAAEVDGHVARGALAFLPITGAYRTAGRLEAGAQREWYEQTTRRARAEGYRGLRVLAELTPLATDPAGCAELLRWEHLADDFMASGAGMTALCAYRRDQLPSSVLADVASVHPQVHAGPEQAPFRIFFDGCGLAVAGTLDAFGADRLTRVLTSSALDPPAVRMDLSRVEFMDAAGCRAIAAWAHGLEERWGPAAITVTGASRMVRRMWQLLGFAELTAVTFEDSAA